LSFMFLRKNIVSFYVTKRIFDKALQVIHCLYQKILDL